MKVSIKTIAKMANCSTATVSNVLNNKGMFSAATKDRVMEVVRKNKYTQNAIGRNLRTGKTETIGITFYRPNADIFSSEFYLTLMRSVERTFAENNYEIILSEYTDTMLERRDFPPFLMKGKVDGMIVLGGFPTETLKLFEQSQKPVVFLDTYSANVDCVITDGKTAVKNTMKTVAEAGHTHVEYFAFNMPDYNTDMRIQGFLEGVEEYGMQKDKCKIHRNFIDNESAAKEFRQMLKQTDLPTLVMTANDKIAIALMRCAQECDIKIPQDISFLGFDGIPLSQIVYPRLATIKTDIDLLGRKGALMMLEKLKNPESKPCIEILTPELELHASFKSKND